MDAGNEEEEYENLAYQQRLKAAVYYTVGRICEATGQQQDVTFSRKFISALTELTFSQTQLFSKDLEAFALHAKRTVINPDDVKLLVRRNPQLLEHIKKRHDVINAFNDAEKERRKKRKKQKTANHSEDDFVETKTSNVE